MKQDEEPQGKWRLACQGDLQEENMHAVFDVFENCDEEIRSVNSLVYLNSTRLDRKKVYAIFKTTISINLVGEFTNSIIFKFDTTPFTLQGFAYM